jgi:hypothetical protein
MYLTCDASTCYSHFYFSCFLLFSYIHTRISHLAPFAISLYSPMLVFYRGWRAEDLSVSLAQASGIVSFGRRTGKESATVDRVGVAPVYPDHTSRWKWTGSLDGNSPSPSRSRRPVEKPNQIHWSARKCIYNRTRVSFGSACLLYIYIYTRLDICRVVCIDQLVEKLPYIDSSREELFSIHNGESADSGRSTYTWLQRWGPTEIQGEEVVLHAWWNPWFAARKHLRCRTQRREGHGGLA